MDGYTFGYARVSTPDQKLDLQIDALIEAGVPEAHIFSEKASGGGIATKRLQLLRCLKRCRKGDTLVIWKLDRLGRNVSELIRTVEILDKRGVEIKCITQPFDTRTAMGKLIFNLFSVLAEFERDLISERTKAGIEAAKARGQTFGAKTVLTPEVTERARELLLDGVSPEKAAVILRKEGHKVSKSTLYNHRDILVASPNLDLDEVGES